MEKFIEEKIKEMGHGMVVSFKKGTDNYNTMKTILIEVYSKGVFDGYDDLPNFFAITHED